MIKVMIWISRVLALIIGVVLTLGGIAGSVWTVWDWIRDFSGNSLIGNLQIIPGVKILILPLVVLGIFASIAYGGVKLVDFARMGWKID